MQTRYLLLPGNFRPIAPQADDEVLADAGERLLVRFPRRWAPGKPLETSVASRGEVAAGWVIGLLAHSEPTAKFSVRVVVDRGEDVHPAGRYYSANANLWPLSRQDAEALAAEERRKPWVTRAYLVESSTPTKG